MVANSSTLLAENTQSVSLIYHDRAIILMLQPYYFWKICKVSLHWEDTIDYNELNGFLRQLLQYTLKVFHIVVFVMKLSGKAQTSSVYNTCVVAVVADNIITTSYHRCQDTRVYRKPCWETKNVFFVHILCEFFLQLYVQIERSIQKSATSTTRTIFVQGFLASLYNPWVVWQTCVGIRTEH